jgi:hypothetical protein
MAARPRRRKVTLALNSEDVDGAVTGRMSSGGTMHWERRARCWSRSRQRGVRRGSDGGQTGVRPQSDHDSPATSSSDPV